MSLYTRLNECVRKMSFFDIKLLQIATACFVILVVKFAPQIIVIRKEWFISIFFIAIAKPFYVFLVKK